MDCWTLFRYDVLTTTDCDAPVCVSQGVALRLFTWGEALTLYKGLLRASSINVALQLGPSIAGNDRRHAPWAFVNKCRTRINETIFS